MNKLILCLLFTAFSAGAFSQKLYFVYFQTETSQPFYVKMNKKVQSSTASGYAIVPRLVDSTYSVAIGFPGQTLPELEFTVSINKKDRGYLIKNFGEKGWGLFDLQAMNILMATNNKSASIEKTTTPSSEISLFASILSQVADDPSLLEKPIRIPASGNKTGASVITPAVNREEVVVNSAPAVDNGNATTKKDEPKTEEVKPSVTEVAVVKKDAPVQESKPVTAEPTNVKVDETVAEAKPKTEYKKSEVIKSSQQEGEEGQDLVFIDTDENGRQDTIRLLIPNPAVIAVKPKETPKEEKKFLDIDTDSGTNSDANPKPAADTTIQKTETQKTAIPEETKKEEIVPPVTESQETSKPEIKKEEPKPVATEPASKPAVVNTCPEIAQESDFLKLRRKMVAGKDDDEMVMEARRYFKTKCFTVYQVRNLGALFLTDEGKYNFFDAAYRHTSDVHNFISLQMELKEEYYINRFKVMLR